MQDESGIPSVEAQLARCERITATRGYGILKVSKRRWAVAKRNIITGSTGVVLDGHKGKLRDWVEYEILEGCESMSRDEALAALYALYADPEPEAAQKERGAT